MRVNNIYDTYIKQFICSKQYSLTTSAQPLLTSTSTVCFACCLVSIPCTCVVRTQYLSSWWSDRFRQLGASADRTRTHPTAARHNTDRAACLCFSIWASTCRETPSSSRLREFGVEVLENDEIMILFPVISRECIDRHKTLRGWGAHQPPSSWKLLRRHMHACLCLHITHV